MPPGKNVEGSTTSGNWIAPNKIIRQDYKLTRPQGSLLHRGHGDGLTFSSMFLRIHRAR